MPICVSVLLAMRTFTGRTTYLFFLLFEQLLQQFYFGFREGKILRGPGGLRPKFLQFLKFLQMEKGEGGRKQRESVETMRCGQETDMPIECPDRL